MCGIVGYISNNDKIYEGPKDHFMRYALALDTLRGEDSTGIVTLSKRFTVKTLKTIMAGDQFVHSKEYQNKFKTGWAQIGHNRAATRGGVSIENAHPFTFGTVTLVHNGTLFNGGRSLESFKFNIGGVDSMQIAYALSESPPEQAKEVLSQVDGSFALVWSDTRDESINMARNSERPLHFTFNSAKSVLWYMSDGHHLHSINKSFGTHECRGQSVFEMDKSKILKFHKGNAKPEVIKFDPFVATFKAKDSGKKKKKTTKTGISSGHNTALLRATEKWKRNLESDSTATLIGGKLSTLKVELQGKKRRVPACMQRALAAELYLCPEDLMQFQPEDAVELINGNYVIYGTVIHTAWDSLWDMTIHNVTRLQYHAYKKADWLVRPIGICPPHEYDEKVVGILGHLVHCDWNGYVAACEKDDEESDDDKEGDSPDGDTLVQGPSGSMIRWSKLQVMLDAGCVHCQGDLQKANLSKCLEVNTGQDLICEECNEELNEKFMTGPMMN